MARAAQELGQLDQLDQLGQRTQQVVMAREQVLPVLPAFEGLLPEPGLRRGTVIRVHGSGATSLALALLAGCTTAGSWVAAIGVRGLGLGAAGELGLALQHLLLVDVPTSPQWPTAVAAALDGVDAVLVEVPPRCREADARRLQSRLRERGSVVVLVGPAGSFQPDLVLAGLPARPGPSRSVPTWQGVGAGWGHLRARCLPVEVTGRRAATRPRAGRLWLPDPDGEVRLEPDTPPRARPKEVVVPLHPLHHTLHHTGAGR